MLKLQLTISLFCFGLATVCLPVTAQDTPEPAAIPTESEAPKILPAKQADLTTEITKSAKLREQRMLALNEAMVKLTEAGAADEAAKLERRLKAMIETKDPREDDMLMANKLELDNLKEQVTSLSTEISRLREVLEQNCRIIDEILSKAVPDISPAVLEELRDQAKKKEKTETRKAP